MGALLKDVLYRFYVIGREGKVGSGVSIAEADDIVDDRDHQDAHEENPFMPRVCCIGVSLDFLILKHDKKKIK